MVFEQVLTIIFAVGVGAAVIVYAARPRHRGASISVGSGIGSFAPTESVQAAPMPQVTAFETPAVESSFQEERAVAEFAPAVDVAAVGSVEVASVATASVNPSFAAPSSVAESVEAPAHVAAGSHRAQRKKSTATKSRAKSTRRTKKK